MKIDALELPLFDHPDASRPVYAHQAAILDAWSTNSTFLVVTRTGTGKTFAAMLPVLRERQFAVAVYPTNELARDQVSAVAQMAQDEGLTPYVREPGPVDRESFARANVVLTPLDAPRLQHWKRFQHRASNGQALDDVLTLGKRPGVCAHIVFVNPDILFLLLAARYRRGDGALASLQSYQVLILDEFHLYQGVELAHALFMAHYARSLHAFSKLLLLSATPPPELRAILDRLWNPTVIDSTSTTARPQVGTRVAVHDVSLTAIPSQANRVEVFESEVCHRVERWRGLRQMRPDPNFLPGVIIIDSVVNAIWLEDRLRQNDSLKGDELLIVRGLSHRGIRTRTGREIAAIGTAAIEVGIDFKNADLIFEASDAASLLQRFGRTGRHAAGDAVLIAPANVLAGIDSLPAHVDRATFEEKVYQWYPRPQTRPWFIETLCGWYSIRSVARGLVRRVRDDYHGTDQDVELAERAVETALAKFADQLGGEHPRFNRQSRVHFNTADTTANTGKGRYQWLRAYERLDTFRTSLPSIWVRDGREARRRGDKELGQYQADLKTLLHRGKGLGWLPDWRAPDGTQGAVTVQGYGGWQSVDVAYPFSAADTGQMFETVGKPNMILSQAGRNVPVSDVMLRQNHIFTVVERALVENQIDWRLPVFPSGEFLVAFDGAALLLHELAQRARQKS